MLASLSCSMAETTPQQHRVGGCEVLRSALGLLSDFTTRAHLQGPSQPDGLVFVDAKGIAPEVQHLATHLRADLKHAGVDRAELFEAQGNCGRFNVHTLRCDTASSVAT